MLKRSTVLTVVLLVALAARAHGGALGVRCVRPLIFPGASVNVVFLPYRYAGDASAVTLTSARISALAQLDTLFSILKYGSVGAVQLVSSTPSEDAECTAEIVAAKLLGLRPGAETLLPPGHSAVLVWGRFYEEAGQTYIQTYVRFFGRDMSVDGVDLSIAGRPFRGRLSSTGFGFTPRMVSKADLEEIQRRASETLRVYESPSTASRSTPMDVSSSRPIVYSVTKVQGDWMRMETRVSGPSGWVRGDAPLDEWSLRRKLPEFTFIEGLVGFLKARTDPAGTDARARRAAADALEKTLGVFANDKSRLGSPTPLATAVGRQMLGVLQLESDGSLEQLARADAAFADAASLVPYSADALNLELMSRFLVESKKTAEVRDAGTYVDAWTLALAREPGNADSVNNLQTFLELLDEDGRQGGHRFSGPPGPEDVRKRLEAVRGVTRTRGGAGG